MKKQTRRNWGWAAGALLAIAAFVTACGGGDSPSNVGSIGEAGSAAGAGGSDTGGTGGSTAGTGSMGGTGGSTGGTAGSAGTGGTTVDAGGTGGDQDAGVGGEAGYSSHPVFDGGDAGAAGEAGAGGSSGVGGSSGTGGDAGSGGTSGTGGSSGAGGTAGTGGEAGSAGSGSGGTGGTMVLPCPADCSGHGACDTTNGVCSCAINFDGLACDKCAVGYVNYPMCAPAMSCPSDCSGHGTCDTTNGQCTCATGFDGLACNQCASGYDNYPTCYAIHACPSDCSGNGSCNNQTGTCSCSTGYTGAACDACVAGYVGYPTCVPAPQPFTCQNTSRDAGFDALKIDGLDIELVGGLWGTSSSNIYVPCGTYSKGGVCRFNGTSWTYTDLTPSPLTVHGIWGSASNDIWLTADSQTTSGLLFHNTGSGWVDDSNKPSAKSFADVWGANSSDVFVVGAAAGWAPKVWRRVGNTWTTMTMPSFTGSVLYRHIWGLDSNNVFVTGYIDSDSDGNPDLGLLLYFDGNSWTSLSVPADCKEMGEIHGTSINDLWVSGARPGGGVVYNITNVTQWTPYSNDGVYTGPVWSKRVGTALALGIKPPSGDGALRMTTIDQISPPLIQQVDNMGESPVKILNFQGSDEVYFVVVSGGISTAGFYASTCD